MIGGGTNAKQGTGVWRVLLPGQHGHRIAGRVVNPHRPRLFAAQALITDLQPESSKSFYSRTGRSSDEAMPMPQKASLRTILCCHNRSAPRRLQPLTLRTGR